MWFKNLRFFLTAKNAKLGGYCFNHRGNREKDTEETETGHKGDLTAKVAKKKRKEFKVGRISF